MRQRSRRVCVSEGAHLLQAEGNVGQWKAGLVGVEGRAKRLRGGRQGCQTVGRAHALAALPRLRGGGGIPSDLYIYVACQVCKSVGGAAYTPA